MKKNLLLIVALVVSISMFGQFRAGNVEVNKQAVHKSIEALAPNFTTTDLNGNVHTLYDYLNSGKTVIIDISATWCQPCWNYHTNGALKDVYNTYGPSGTNEMMVFMIEGDPTTDTSELWNAAGTGYGDWTANVPYPICNDDSIAQKFNLPYWPYIVMVCPTGDWYEVGQGITNYFTAAEYYQLADDNCPSLTDAPICDFSGPSSGMMGAALDFMDESFGLPTSWSWTFQGGTPATSTDQNPTVSWSVGGTYDITFEATNANGTGTAVTKQILIIDPSNINDLNVTFEECTNNWTNDFQPYAWTTVDGDMGTVWGDYGDVGITGERSFDVYDHADADANSLTNLQPHGGGKAAMCMNVVTADAPNDDWFISPQIQLGTSSQISLWAASLSTQWGEEEFYVAVSTTDNSPASFTHVGPKHEPGTSYTDYTVDLSAYDGQQVYIAIHCVSNDHWVLFIDDILISSNLGETTLDLNPMRIYPNPTNGILNVENVKGSTVYVYNVLGEVVASIGNADQFNTINMSGFENGTYMVKVINENQVSTRKVVLNR
jgi:PKD repeat protein